MSPAIVCGRLKDHVHVTQRAPNALLVAVKVEVLDTRRQAAATLAKLSTDGDWDHDDRMSGRARCSGDFADADKLLDGFEVDRRTRLYPSNSLPCHPS